jgi:hypothetical protein
MCNKSIASFLQGALTVISKITFLSHPHKWRKTRFATKDNTFFAKLVPRFGSVTESLIRHFTLLAAFDQNSRDSVAKRTEMKFISVTMSVIFRVEGAG